MSRIPDKPDDPKVPEPPHTSQEFLEWKARTPRIDQMGNMLTWMVGKGRITLLVVLAVITVLAMGGLVSGDKALDAIKDLGLLAVGAEAGSRVPKEE